MVEQALLLFRRPAGGVEDVEVWDGGEPGHSPTPTLSFTTIDSACESHTAPRRYPRVAGPDLPPRGPFAK